MGKHVQTVPIDSFISIDSAKSEIINTPFSDSIVHNNENEVISKKPSEKIRTDKKSENIYSSSDINKFKYKLDSILSLIKIELDSVDNSKSTKVDLLIKRQKKIEQDGKSAKTIFSFEKLIKSAQELENELDKYPKVKK